VTPDVSELENQLQLKTITNPFSSSLAIQFNLNERKKININLCDSKGARIKQVYDGERSAGLQKFIIDGTQLSMEIISVRS
jgi:hypothetical protein